MKRYLITGILLIISCSVFPQDKKYFDAPFGGGGGFIAGWHIPNIDPLNVQLQRFGAPEFSTSGIFTTGGGGFIYIGFINNLRVGGFGFGGSTSESANINGFAGEAVYSISGGAFTVEYTLPFIKNIGVSLGLALGGGSININLYRNRNNFNWDDVWSEITTGSTENISRNLEKNYWILTPTLNIDIPVYRFIALRLGAGYQISLGEEWTIENEKIINNVPSDLNAANAYFQAGIFIGFFSY